MKVIFPVVVALLLCAIPVQSQDSLNVKELSGWKELNNSVTSGYHAVTGTSSVYDSFTELKSPIFRPPTDNWRFVMWPSNHLVCIATHVDIWQDPDNEVYMHPRDKRPRDTETEIQARVRFLRPVSAGSFPMRCEGNLRLKPRDPVPGGSGGGGGGGGSSEPTRFHWSAKIDPGADGAIDLDIDSDNNGGIYGPPDRLDAEDAIEEAFPGKYIPRNDGDEDHDNIQSFADGFGLAGPGSGSSSNTHFVPLVLDISRAGSIDRATARIRIDYSASPPSALASNSLPGAPDKTYHVPAPGLLRLWTTNAAARNAATPPAGHYLAPGEYAASALFPVGVSNATWYAEGIRQGVVTGLVTVALKPSATAGWLEDKVFCSVVHGDIDVDSDNNNATAHPDKNGYEDRIEVATRLDGSPYYGKLLCVNDGDLDKDGTVDYMDWHITNVAARFTPVAITLKPLLGAAMRLKLDYPACPPGVTPSASHSMRLWTLNASHARTASPFPAGHYLAPRVYTGTELLALGFSTTNTVHFGIEGVFPATNQTISISVDPDGSAGPAIFVHTDQVNVTIIKVELDVKPKGVGDYESLPDPIQIAAGGFASPVHQADVVIQVEPALAGIPIAFGLLNGVGHERHAKLEAAGLTTVGGGDVIVIETGEGGILNGVLTSSDSLDICTVHAGLSGSDCQESQPVKFNWIWKDAFDVETDWIIEPAWFDDVGIYTNKLRIRHHRKEDLDAPVLPLDQHVVRFYVEKVVYLDDEGEEQVLINTADTPSTNVNEWAVFVDAATTDADGEATAYLDIKKIDGLVYLKFKAYDWSVYWESPFDSESPSSDLVASESISLSSALSDDRNEHTYLDSQGGSSPTYPFIAHAPKYVPVVVSGYAMNAAYGGGLILCLQRDTAAWSLRFSELGEGDGDWVVVDDSIIYAMEYPAGVVTLLAPYYSLSDTSRNRFLKYIIVARRKGRFRAEFLRNGVRARYHEFEAVEGHWNAVGESMPLEVDSHAVFPIHASTQTPPNFKVRYQLTADLAGDYAITNHTVNLGAFLFESLPASSLDIWANTEGEQTFRSEFKLASLYYINGLTAAGDLLSITNIYTRLGTTTPIRLIAADMKIAKPTGETPRVGELGAGVSPEDSPLFVFDTAAVPGKCVARCEAAPLTGLSDATRALVWGLIEWKLPNVGSVEPGDGDPTEAGKVTTFTYNSMPTHTDDYGNTNITLCFKGRPTWAYHQPVQFRYNRTGTSAATAALAAGTIGADYATAGNPNWYVYWQQVANQFQNITEGEASGIFGPQSTKMVYNSADDDGDGHPAAYQPLRRTPTWKDEITMYAGSGSRIYDFIWLLHHENGHRHSFQLPPDKGGFGTDLTWSHDADADVDGINDTWEVGVGAALGFDVNSSPESMIKDQDMWSNWHHGWFSLDHIETPPESPYTNSDGYNADTGSGLTVRNQNHVEVEMLNLRKKDWSSIYTAPVGE